MFEVDVPRGLKTGFYLDQRTNRAACGARGTVLDCFAYTGGLRSTPWPAARKDHRDRQLGGRRSELLQRNVALNKLPACECIEGDVFQLLRKLRDRARSFDLIVLDPPKFAPTAACGSLARRTSTCSRSSCASGRLAVRLFSCSGGVSRELFQSSPAQHSMQASMRRSSNT
jgi:23S rRNA (cytosine1962-C5)-methyltransferase